MRLFVLLTLAFFASFLSFRGQRYVFSELIFLVLGLLIGRFVKGVSHNIYLFFELFLLGFFGIIYGMSIDVARLFKTSLSSVKRAFIEVISGVFLLLLLTSLLHPRISFWQEMAVISFILIGASPYFIKGSDREEVVAVYFLPAIITTLVGIFHFHFKEFLILMVLLVIIAVLMRLAEGKASDVTTSLSIVLGGAVLVPYMAIRYGESPFFYAFFLGFILNNVLKSRRIMKLLFTFKEDERLFFLVFIFIVGLSAQINVKVVKIAIIIYVVRVLFKIISAKTIYSSKNIMYHISQGGIGLIIAVDALGPGNLLSGVGASLVFAYLLNLIVVSTGSIKR